MDTWVYGYDGYEGRWMDGWIEDLGGCMVGWMGG